MAQVHTPQSRCRVGVARCDITPPIGIYHRMWGAATHDQSTGVHRPLTATAIDFMVEGRSVGPATEQVVVAVDHCLLGAREMHTLLTSVAKETGLRADQVTVAFSHTHAAGLMGLERHIFAGGELIGPYLKRLGQQLVEIIRQARRGPPTVWITYAAGHCALAAHRDFLDPQSGQIVCGFHPEGPADDTVLVARVTDEISGKLLATIVNYACHPTSLGWQNTLISPDFPGALRELVEQSTGAPCVFLQGASGDLGPRVGFVGDPAIADANGRQLAHAALSVLEAMPPAGTVYRYAGPVVSGATLGTWAHEPFDEATVDRCTSWRRKHWAVPLPYRPELPTWDEASAQRDRFLAEEKSALAAGDAHRARDCRAMAERAVRTLSRLLGLPGGSHFPLPVSMWIVGDACWLAVESEHYQDLQVQLRRRFPDMPIIVMTLANGARASYLPRADAYGKGIYQETIAVLAAGSLEQLIEEIGQTIEQWRQSS